MSAGVIGNPRRKTKATVKIEHKAKATPQPNEDADRLKSLKAKLDRARREGSYGPPRASSGAGRSAGMAVGLRVVVDLAAGVVAGTVIGIVLDRFLGTSPWFLLIFFLIGSAAGFLNVYRTAQELDRKRKIAKEQGG